MWRRFVACCVFRAGISEFRTDKSLFSNTAGVEAQTRSRSTKDVVPIAAGTERPSFRLNRKRREESRRGKLESLRHKPTAYGFAPQAALDQRNSPGRCANRPLTGFSPIYAQVLPALGTDVKPSTSWARTISVLSGTAA